MCEERRVKGRSKATFLLFVGAFHQLSRELFHSLILLKSFYCVFFCAQESLNDCVRTSKLSEIYHGLNLCFDLEAYMLLM